MSVLGEYNWLFHKTRDLDNNFGSGGQLYWTVGAGFNFSPSLENARAPRVASFSRGYRGAGPAPAQPFEQRGKIPAPVRIQ